MDNAAVSRPGIGPGLGLEGLDSPSGPFLCVSVASSCPDAPTLTRGAPWSWLFTGPLPSLGLRPSHLEPFSLC